MTRRISRSSAPILSLLLAACIAPARAQDTSYETWPELDAFVNLNGSSRLFFLAAGTRIKEQGNTDGSLGAHIDFFTSPFFRNRLDRTARRADVARNKFLQFRFGYLYSRSAKGSTSKFSEHTPTFEASPRYYFPKHILTTSRIRGDFRFVNGVFTPRARFRQKIERSFRLRRTAITPYAHAEAFYDWRYDVWHRFRFSGGAEWELNRHLVLEGYYLHQRDNRSSTKYVNVLGISVQLYLR